MKSRRNKASLRRKIPYLTGLAQPHRPQVPDFRFDISEPILLKGESREKRERDSTKVVKSPFVKVGKRGINREQVSVVSGVGVPLRLRPPSHPEEEGVGERPTGQVKK